MTGSSARAVELLGAALDLPEAAREAFLVRECGADEALLAQLRALLAADRDGWDALDAPLDGLAAEVLAESESIDLGNKPGDAIGPWRLVRELGRGGMGAVWLAERVDGEFDQKVALKLLRLGMDSEHILRQFRRERALLARLQHPNIAQLIDGGIDARGRPWFAMECIEGQTLDAWVEAQQPGLRARLELFVKLCQAVAHAHGQLIVHRDLKPSNVLVQTDGEPRLLDFGIATLLDPDGHEQTVTMHRFLTRDFAAPEQLRGDVAVTATDVYALGLILFELLTGRRYRALHTMGAATLRPSTALGGETTAPPRISRARLRGDLDAIVTHALADEPARRYRSAQELADDVQRHLGGRPIQARPDRFGYRAAKFVRRNRVAVAAAVFGLVALVSGSAVAFWQAVEKTAEAERARLTLRQSEATRGFLVSIFLEADPGAGKGPDTTVGELLAVARERAGRELADEPEVAAQLLDQIGNSYVSIGDDVRAHAVLDEALAFNARARQPSLVIEGTAGARVAHYQFHAGDREGGQARLDALIGRLQDAVAAGPEFNAPLGKALELRQNMFWQLGNREAAHEASEAAVRAWERVRGDRPLEFLSARMGHASLEAALGNGESALALIEAVLADLMLQPDGPPPTLLASARGVRLRALQALGRHAEAEPLIVETITAFAALHGMDNQRTRYWRHNHAMVLFKLGRDDEAQAVADAIVALPPEMGHIYTELLAAQIAARRNATDAPARIAAARLSACEGPQGTAELCSRAQAIGVAPAEH